MSKYYSKYKKIKLKNLIKKYIWNIHTLNNIKNNEYITKLLNPK